MNDVSILFSDWLPILRIVVVGTLSYILLILLYRLSGKRTLAKMNAFDLLITVTLGSAYGRILTARNVPLAEASTAFILLVILQFVVARLRTRSPKFAALVDHEPTLLFYKGDFIWSSMQKERVSREEIFGAVRLSGVGSLDGVEAVVMEVTGKLSVIREGASEATTILPDAAADAPSTASPR